MKKSTKTVSFDEKKEKVDRIREKIAELGEKRAATEEKWKNADPMEKVALEKTMQQESDTMILLERELAETEKAVVENLLPPMDDRAEIYGGIQKYINEDKEKQQAVFDKFTAIKEQISKAEEKLPAMALDAASSPWGSSASAALLLAPNAWAVSPPVPTRRNEKFQYSRSKSMDPIDIPPIIAAAVNPSRPSSSPRWPLTAMSTIPTSGTVMLASMLGMESLRIWRSMGFIGTSCHLPACPGRNCTFPD